MQSRSYSKLVLTVTKDATLCVDWRLDKTAEQLSLFTACLTTFSCPQAQGRLEHCKKTLEAQATQPIGFGGVRQYINTHRRTIVSPLETTGNGLDNAASWGGGRRCYYFSTAALT